MRLFLKLLVACVGAFLLTTAPATAQVVMNGDYVTVDTAFRSESRWFLQPIGRLLYLRRGEPRGLNIETFRIEKLDTSNGQEVRGGDRIRLRGINSDYNGGQDPYIMIEGSRSFIVNVTRSHPELGANDPTILIIEGNRSGIQYGDDFQIHGTEDYWLCGDCLHNDIPVVASAPRSWSSYFKFGIPSEGMTVDNQSRRPPAGRPQTPRYCFENCSPGNGSGSGSAQSASGCVVQTLIGPTNVWRYKNTCGRNVRATIRRTCIRNSGNDYREVTITVGAGQEYDFNRLQMFGSYCEPPYNTLTEGVSVQVFE